MKRIALFIVCCVAILCSNILSAQSIGLTAANNGMTYNLCSGYIFDNSETGDYSANQDRHITICPPQSQENSRRISLTFEEFDIHTSDTFLIYQGTSITSPIMTRSDNRPYFSGDDLEGLSVTPSLMMTSGCLTIRLISNNNQQAAGFKAKIECTALCQYPEAALDTFFYKVNEFGEYTSHPVGSGVDTLVMEDGSIEIINYKTVDLCFGDSVVFVAKPSFPENDIIYHQSAEDCIYEWSFGNGQSQTVEYNTLGGVLYSTPRGYELNLIIEDTNNGGCRSRNLLNTRVRITDNPIAAVESPKMCSGTEFSFSVGYDSESQVVVDSLDFQQAVRERYENTVFIPDGPNCRDVSPTGCYDAPVTFDQFPAGAMVNSIDDILSLCINMEHSFLGDLGFQVICPNGQNAILKHNTHNGGSELGIVVDDYSTCSNTCSAECNPQGTGWTYCFSNQYLESAMGVIRGTLPSPIDSTNTEEHTGYFQTPIQEATDGSEWNTQDLNGFEGLVGCPLNGEWRLRICDDWGDDNGYVFWWDLELRQSSSINWDYSIAVDSVFWSVPSFSTQENQNSTTFTPPIDSVGNYLVEITLKDEFGCVWDTVSTLQVIQTPVVNLGADITMCDTTSVELDAGFESTTATYLWTPTGDTTKTINLEIDIESLSEAVYGVEVSETVDGITCSASDSIKVFVNPTVTDTISATICHGTTYSEYGFSVSEAGTHVQNLQTIKGCDSTIVLNLTVNPSYSTVIDTAICFGETYSDNGFSENQTGTYTQNLQTVNGCDSIITLNLSVNPLYSDTINAVICSNETYSENGFSENTTGIFVQNLQSISGCDSIVVLNLTVNEFFDNTIEAQICEGQVYSNFGFEENETGTYTQNLQTLNGCDSIVRLNLVVNEVFSTSIEAAICNGETYSENGFSETKTGVYTRQLQCINGCDSTVTLNLTVNEVYNIEIDASICEGETYNENGFIEYEAGDYTLELQTRQGCDSTITLHLNVNPAYNIRVTELIGVDGYVGHGFSETQAGVYTHYETSSKGCDSIFTLVLEPKDIAVSVANAFMPLEPDNNRFCIYPNEDFVTITELRIFNRNGTVVFATSDINECWDGTFNGEYVPQGVYTYHFFYNRASGTPKRFEKKGTIMVIY